MLDNCRICLKFQTDMPCTTSVIDTTTYNEELHFCIPEIDWESTDVPSLICCNCIKNLEIAVSFRRLCLESHKVRTTYIEGLNKSFSGEEQVSKAKGSILKTSTSEIPILNGEHDSLSASYDEDNVEIDIVEDLQENINATRVSSSKSDSTTKSIQNDFFSTNTNIQKYEIANESSEDVKPYVPSRKDRTCIFCSCTFSKYSTLVNHIRSVHTFEKCFKCEYCGEGFTNSEILSRHRNRHTGERKYVCSYCGKKFYTNSDLNHHVQRHQNKRNYKCDLCENKSFNTANSLRTHKLVVHTNPNEWRHLCPMCGRKCVTQASLTVHMKRHSNEKDFVCHLCLKKFCTKSELSKHISSHSNMRLHKCEMCNQEYKDRKVLERHLTKKHGIGNAKIVERAKKYVCNVCPKKFIGRRQLEKHLRSHNGIRPFKCELCEQAFICSSYIKGHMRTKHSANV